MDRKAIVVVALCVLALVFWRPLMRAVGLGRYVDPPRPVRLEAPDTTRVGGRTVPQTTFEPETTATPDRRPVPGAPSMPQISAGVLTRPSGALERTLDLETPYYRATFTSRGARLLSVQLKRFASARGVSSIDDPPRSGGRKQIVPPGDRVTLAGTPLFGIDLGSGLSARSLENVGFAVEESLDVAGDRRAITFTAQDESGLYLRQTYRIRPDDYALELEVELRGVQMESRITEYSLTARSWPLITESDVVADARGLRATSLVGTNLHREHAGGLLKGPRSFEGSAVWAAVQSRYFLCGVGVLDGSARGVISYGERRPLAPAALELLPPGSKPEQEVVTQSLVVGVPPQERPIQRFLLYVGPSEYFRLASFGLELERAVDLGWTWVTPFSKTLLQLLNWLYSWLRNYGVAILVLATLVRVLLHPLNMISMKSMRAMQKLQPEIERIRAKYKEDPQAMNAAVMAIYKENKVNPAGGCLPMLVQMPLFIALYQVLFNAIELRQAPFVAWMSDLSAPEELFSLGGFPIRLLPILMATTGLLMQKLTPTDPRQLPMMYMMNLVMLVFFYNLPSGLVLYWTVMNVLTALQQWLVLRHDGPPPAAVPVPAKATGGAVRKRRATAR